MAPAKVSGSGGFTLLEVLIAFAILSVAVVSLIELTSQGLRLLKVSGDHQQAVLLADRIARETQVNSDEVKPDAAAVDTGEDGNFAWERRIERLPLPEELEPKQTLPGKEVPGLYAVSVAVRWGRGQSVQVATLRAPAPVSPTAGGATPTDQPGQTLTPGVETPGAPTPRPTQTGPSTTRDSGGSARPSTRR